MIRKMALDSCVFPIIEESYEKGDVFEPSGEVIDTRAVEVATLTDLIGELHKVFESDHVNVEHVNALMSAYKSNPAEWRKYAKFDRFR